MRDKLEKRFLDIFGEEKKRIVKNMWKIQSNMDSIWHNFSLLTLVEKEKANLKNLLKECWNYDFENRISSKKLLEMDFFKELVFEQIQF